MRGWCSSVSLAFFRYGGCLEENREDPFDEIAKQVNYRDPIKHAGCGDANFPCLEKTRGRKKKKQEERDNVQPTFNGR